MARRDLDEWLWQIGTELQRLSREVAPGGPKLARGSAWQPRVDVAETSDSLVIKAELAGIGSEDVRISLDLKTHTLLLRGVRSEEDLQEGARCGYHQIEIDYGEFEREISLPEVPIEAGGMGAQYRNGFLIVIIPKALEPSTKVLMRRTITVRKTHV
ncbi:MAG TPA: Hsp20/alpha crystallin family protein [Fimbriimonadaceae bacterium]|nr:Hsp20/alpha crystallin family protein [Fimbriimonadaceae bacterium]